MDCPTCGAPARPDSPDMVANSSDGPLLVTRWRCAANHWWHMTAEVSPGSCGVAGCGPAEWLANELGLAIAPSRNAQPGRQRR